MPYRIELPSDGHVEVFVQSTVDSPVLHVETCIGLLELGNTDLHTFQHRVLDLFHLVCHRDLEFNHFSLATTLQRLCNCDMESRPEGGLSQEQILQHIGQRRKSGRKRFGGVRERFEKANLVELPVYPDNKRLESSGHYSENQ